MADNENEPNADTTSADASSGPDVVIFKIPPLSDSEQEEVCDQFNTPEVVRGLVLDLADGNIGALRVCAYLASKYRFGVLKKMDELGLRGQDIWLAYKDLGGETYDGLEKVIFTADLCSRLKALGY